MARELRTLLLWGCRLRAPALAVARGGEGGRAGRVESERGRRRAEPSGSRAPFLRGRRGDGSSLLGVGDFVRFTRPRRRERRTLSSRCVMVSPGSAPRRAAGFPRR